MTEIPELPPARLAPRRRYRFQLIWLIPAIAVLVGGWLALRAIMERGPTVTISFATAEGLEPGKTRIRYKDVDIGMVNAVSLSPDRSRVLVTASFLKQAENLLVADTRFWVVRPRFAGGQLTGIGTLLAGAHIGVDVGRSTESAREFVGDEVAPIITAGLPGRQYRIHAPDLGSIDIGSPVFYRRLKVGEVEAYSLDKDGKGVSLKVFIKAPYDRYVTPTTRFWNASGIDVTLDAGGLRVQTQSAMAILVGGMAFENLPGEPNLAQAPADSTFSMHRDRAEAMKAPDGQMQVYVMNFRESLRGLSPGAPVDFRGVVVGEVLSMGVEYEPAREWFHFPVYVAIYPERIAMRRAPGAAPGDADADAQRVKKGLIKAIAERGFRAQLRTGNLLTGQLYVALDFFKDAKKVVVNPAAVPQEFPTVYASLEDLQASLGRILKNLEQVPFAEVAADARQTLQGLDKLARRLDAETAPEAQAALASLRTTLGNLDRTLAADAPLLSDVRDATREISRAAQALRSLADTLDRQPEALLKGKREEQP